MNESTRYQRLEDWCHQSVQEGRDFLFDPKLFPLAIEKASLEFGYEINAVNSFLRSVHLNHVKVTSPHVKRNIYQHAMMEYTKKGVSMTTLAKRINFPPYMLCRAILEAVISIPKKSKKEITQLLKDTKEKLGSPTVLRDEFLESEQHWSDEQRKGTTRLAMEAQQCIDSDPMYGPMQDRIRHCVGIQYEVMLEECLKKMEIPFETESQLREKGSSRTPDVLLQVPIGVQIGSAWKVVCWIDSKAMFGDIETHNTSNLPQAESYVHRFGPGMMLYWFGHAPLERLGNARGDICIASNLPETFMWPTGELHH